VPQKLHVTHASRANKADHVQVEKNESSEVPTIVTIEKNDGPMTAIVENDDNSADAKSLHTNHTDADANVPAVFVCTHEKFVVPQKPELVEGINMSSLAVAYFCMEMGLEGALPTYAGGLGMLAGDMLRSFADLRIDAIGISLLYHKGYFKQRFDQSGWQCEDDDAFDPTEKLILLPVTTTITLEGRQVALRAWLYKISGVTGNKNPVIFLDADIPENSDADRKITSQLYIGDRRMRLLQEAVLGIGGIRMLQAIGATNIQKFHMNEGHSALLTLELYRAFSACKDPIDEVRRHAVFTTHTPVAAGHDVFTRELAESILGEHYIDDTLKSIVYDQGSLNMTHLGFNLSSYRNGVAKRHGEVTRELFPGYRIESITNGVHTRQWVNDPIAQVFDRHIPGWRLDAYNLRYAVTIPPDELWDAHLEMKTRLCARIHAEYPNANFDPNIFTIGFARRATAYKRGNMLFHDIERLKRIAEKCGGIQIVYAGKAHPDDHEGKLMMQDVIHQMSALVGSKVRCVYLSNYDIDLGKLLVGGVDLWLNTPVRPLEASGTSGMKAALNGVPHFSTLDGWWLEGHIEHVTGWSIGPHPEQAHDQSGDPQNSDTDVNDLYTKLEYVILPKFTNDRYEWIKTMRSAIAVNGSFFNTQRMVEQYVLGAYFK
jgi:starch phosphorylase